MNTLTIGLSAATNWFRPFAWVIEKGYGISYSHCYVKCKLTKTGEFAIFQASGTKVNFLGWKKFLAKEKVIYEYSFNVTDEKFEEFLNFAVGKVGTPYGVLQCFGLAWVRINEMLGRKVLNPFADGNQTYVCSELAASVLEKFDKIDIPEQLDSISPKELYDVVSKLAIAQANALKLRSRRKQPRKPKQNQ